MYRPKSACFLCLAVVFACLWAVLPRIARADQPPVVTAPSSVVVNEGQTICFDVNSSDPDGDPITSCTVNGAPPGSSFSPAPGGSSTFCWTPDFNSAGTHTPPLTPRKTHIGAAVPRLTGPY